VASGEQNTCNKGYGATFGNAVVGSGKLQGYKLRTRNTEWLGMVVDGTLQGYKLATRNTD